VISNNNTENVTVYFNDTTNTTVNDTMKNESIVQNTTSELEMLQKELGKFICIIIISQLNQQHIK
jgi:hypothetical protein